MCGLWSNYRRNLRAFVIMATEEETLSAMISDTFVCLSLAISTFLIATQDARLKILLENWKMINEQDKLHVTHFS